MSETTTKPRVGRPKGTGTQRVYQQMRQDILQLALPPGADISEARLEEQFGVSRTPVREALIRLASEGLITLLPNQGARVSSIELSDIAQMFEMLELTQRAVNRWCAVRRDPGDIPEMRRLSDAFTAAATAQDPVQMGDLNRSFHAFIGACCGNRFISGVYESQLMGSQRLAHLAFADAPLQGEDQAEYYAELNRQHAAMVDAIERQDGAAADRLAVDHVELFRSRVQRYIDRSLAGEITLSDP
ncbi:MAG: GntR family transcriptional regulator [Hyphomicrobiales bacterium]